MHETKINTKQHIYSVSTISKATSGDKFLFKTRQEKVNLSLYITGISQFVIGIHKCEGVRKEGAHIRSNNIDDNDPRPALSEVYINPDFKDSTNWERTFISPITQKGSIHVILKPNTAYVISVEEFTKTTETMYLLDIKWGEGEK